MLAAIAAVVDSAGEDVGQALMLEGHPGIGKTRLHEAALDHARRRGFRVIRAAGAELERSVPFGVAGQLLRALLADADHAARATMLDRAPAAIKGLLGYETLEDDAHSDLGVSHALFATLADCAQARPALIAIDDLHWCDQPSLSFLLYVLHRLGELPVAIVLTRRPGITGEPDELFDAIAAHPRVGVETVAPLGIDAVCQLAKGALGERADDSVAEACWRVTAGNPFYLRELLLTLSEQPEAGADELARLTNALAPDAVIRALRVRIGRVGPAGAALVRAVAILGAEVPLRRAAALAGLASDEAARAADALATIEILLAREPLGFVHPLVARTVEADIPPAERATLHLQAARMLDREGDQIDRVAAHLLLARPAGDGWVVERLQAAAAEARSRGAAESAIAYLERALTEPPTPERRHELLAELGAAEAAAGRARAVDHLGEAAAACADPCTRARYHLRRGQVLYAEDHHEQAAAAYETGLAELDDASEDPVLRELHDELQTGFIASASLVPALHARSARRSAELLARVDGEAQTHGQRLLLAQAAAHRAFAGEPASEVVELAWRAWADGQLLERDTEESPAWTLVTSALAWSGQMDEALGVIETVLEDARRRSSPRAFATASYTRGAIELSQGWVSKATANLELALDARRYGWRQFARAADAFYCLCLIERGELKAAEQALSASEPLGDPNDFEDALRLIARAELRLAHGDATGALTDAVATGRTLGPEVKVVGLFSWRSVAARAALALGDRDRAAPFAREDLQIADRRQAPYAQIRARRVLGLVEGELDLVRSAVALGAQRPQRLETLRALIDLGAMLRRANHRTEAREPLQRAADLALAAGATVLHERARVELSASGARPRREMLLSGPESLTPSERRIAELAAEGQSNRDIAQALFVTPKTVEYHLRNTYRKLDVEGRRELAGVLAA